ncbi:DesA/ISL3 alpha bundle tail domain-containing protein [Banduia mediterranea]|uniref:DesA/ISL3 alpha bundle tail domain-containing protein n=1 Tax=Banduia mediterranea TaxID=3075609 RepID=UPI003D77C18D
MAAAWSGCSAAVTLGIARLEELMRANQTLATVYTLKEQLQTLWRKPDEDAMRQALNAWCTLARGPPPSRPCIATPRCCSATPMASAPTLGSSSPPCASRPATSPSALSRLRCRSACARASSPSST